MNEVPVLAYIHRLTREMTEAESINRLLWHAMPPLLYIPNPPRSLAEPFSTYIRFRNVGMATAYITILPRRAGYTPFSRAIPPEHDEIHGHFIADRFNNADGNLVIKCESGDLQFLAFVPE